MKSVQAFIRPKQLDDVYEALRKNHYYGLTIFEGEGTGKFTDPDSAFPSLDFPYMHSKVVKIEMICADENYKEIIDIIQRHSSTNERGDGIIYTSDVKDVVRIRDGQKGPAVLQERSHK